MKPTILLVSTNSWLTPVRVARTFADLGCAVQAVCPPQNALTLSKAVAIAHPYRGFQPIRSIEAAIDLADPRLVVPCDDLATVHLHAIYKRAIRNGVSRGAGKAEMLVRSLGDPTSFSALDSRQEFMDRAREAGALVPGSAWIPDLRRLEAWLLENGFPAVLKADCTSGGEGVRIVHTPAQARRAFRELARRRPTARTLKRLVADADVAVLARTLRRDGPLVSVQRFIEGCDANVAVSCSRGEVLAQIAAAVLQTRGAKGPAAVIRLVENPQMEAAVEAIVRRLGLSGLLGFDFLIENRTGKAYLLEVNPRATQTCHLELGPGRHPIAALCASLLGAPASPRPSVTARQTIVLWPHLPGELLTADVAAGAYFDTPNHDPEIVRRYGSRRRFAWAKTLKTLWRAARA